MVELVDWSEDGSPRSARFNDRYHSCSGGITQAASVFLAGCGLPKGWRGQAKFTVLETGFGLGMNFLTTWAAWEADPQRCDQLHFCSVEAHPVEAADMVRAVTASAAAGASDQADPDRIQRLAQELARVCAALSAGFHQFRFAQGQVALTLGIGDVTRVLPALECVADVVYLDGFSPRLNPDMWSLPTLQAMALHCKPGTRLATYTVARSVREALSQVGFAVRKCQGLPPKRDRLEANFAQPHEGSAAA